MSKLSNFLRGLLGIKHKEAVKQPEEVTEAQAFKERCAEQSLQLSRYIELAVQLNYEVFEDDSKPYNLNIVGWRGKHELDGFSDTLAVYYKYENAWRTYQWPITTRPGKFYYNNPINASGTAIMVPGQYKRCYAIRDFKGYECLKQIKPIRVYRDADLDSESDEDSRTIQQGVYGIHIHRAGADSKIVHNWSAGCQVFKRRKDFEVFMWLCRKAAEEWGNSFTYTLVEN